MQENAVPGRFVVVGVRKPKFQWRGPVPWCGAASRVFPKPSADDLRPSCCSCSAAVPV